VDHAEIWRQMERAVDQGLTKSIGLSNFNQKQIEHVLDHCRIKPAILQVRGHGSNVEQWAFWFKCETVTFSLR
jgi:diketogulonate reductase-like aldo/keto reductase